MKRNIAKFLVATTMIASMVSPVFAEDAAIIANTDVSGSSANVTDQVGISESGVDAALTNPATPSSVAASPVAPSAVVPNAANSPFSYTTPAVPNTTTDINTTDVSGNINSATNPTNNEAADIPRIGIPTGFQTKAERAAQEKMRSEQPQTITEAAASTMVEQRGAKIGPAEAKANEGYTKLDGATYIIRDGEDLWIVSGKFKAKLDVLIYSDSASTNAISTEKSTISSDSSSTTIPVIEAPATVMAE